MKYPSQNELFMERIKVLEQMVTNDCFMGVSLDPPMRRVLDKIRKVFKEFKETFS